MPKVLILIGSKSDSKYAEECQTILNNLGIDNTLEISSAHRQPDRTDELSKTASEKGYEVVICMAGMAAALPGVVAARTKLPVIGVPLPATLEGIDSLLAIAQMPSGVPVATMGIGKAGAKNAAILSARILAIKYEEIIKKLDEL
ncbi:MAG: 5-(carboxyamino)imidazole ribonucleotide mutase [candidate division Zixibacteria bacterium]|nr:5-(carboxyamino)imidazole ribonucleotide mutase [candidate division Zixibacteria bacterium]MCP4706574.1 5-(carboxyamino)imidazole ribonucleotide mutase [candidate division Zixibacteria bacterium]